MPIRKLLHSVIHVKMGQNFKVMVKTELKTNECSPKNFQELVEQILDYMYQDIKKKRQQNIIILVQISESKDLTKWH